MRHRPGLPAALLLLAIAGIVPARAGPWQSLARPYTYTSLLVQGDTVWCATLEAGLLQYWPGSGTPDSFLAYRREPGGISSNRITALAMERSRRLWVGTDGGGISLLSADRTRWDLVSIELPSNNITALTAMGDSVFIGTNKGIALWDGRAIAGAIPASETEPSPFGDTNISGIVPVGDSLWISNASGAWVSRISAGFQTWSLAADGFFAPPVQGLARAGRSLFALSQGAVYLFDPTTARWGVIGLQGATVDGTTGKIGRVIRLTGQNGVLIASTSVGFWRWRTGNQWDLISDAFASSGSDPRSQYVTAVGADGRIWAGDQLGLAEQGSTPYNWPVHAPISPPGDNVINLYLQGSSLYATTYDEGVGRFDGTRWYNWRPVPCSGSGCDTTFRDPVFAFGLLVDTRGHKWVACWSGPLEEFDDSAPSTAFIHHEVPDPATEGTSRHSFGWAMVNDRQGGHWVGLAHNGITEPIQAQGIDVYDPVGNYLRGFRPDNVSSMADWEVRSLLDAPLPSGRERIYVGYSERAKGLQYVDLPVPATSADTASMFKNVGGADALEVIGLAAYGDSLWALTTQDIRLYGLADPTLRVAYSTPGNKADYGIHPLEIGLDGTVWIGTENGLRGMHPGGRVEDFNVGNSPLLDNRVRAIRVDPRNGRLWISTGGGINLYDPAYVPPADTVPAVLVIQAYPNPVMITSLGVSIRIRGNSAHYRVDVIDVRGRRVRHLDGVANAQPFWNARDDSGNLVRPGIYFIRVEAGGRTATARVALIR